MQTITAITPHPRRPGRFALEVDGRELATLSIDSIERLRLATGAVLDEPAAAAVEREAEQLATYDRALNMLASRARSSADLRRVLIKKGETPAHVDSAIARLTQAGYLDDADFAR